MPMNRALIKAVSVIHRFWYSATGGVIGFNLGRGRKTLLLTTTGRKSGKRHTTPLLYLEDSDRYVVIGSNGGHTTHPHWWLNLEADSGAQVQVKGDTFDVMAEESAGEERERLWGQLVELYPDYEEYKKTANRQIPVVVLRPKDGP